MRLNDVAYIQNFLDEVEALYEADYEGDYIPNYIEEMIVNIRVILKEEKEDNAKG